MTSSARLARWCSKLPSHASIALCSFYASIKLHSIARIYSLLCSHIYLCPSILPRALRLRLCAGTSTFLPCSFLDRDEFAVCWYLITWAKTGKPLPDELPTPVVPPTKVEQWRKRKEARAGAA